ncbi:MAG: hypothetical protein Q4D81_13515, partial [Eubacteriales bacterium]|nr:hypothetical protein [Eubacteriales bacterium]
EYGDFFYSKNYENFHAYARSKLCLARYSYALAKRMEGSNIRVLMNHPGMALTPMGLNAYGLAEEDASVIVRHLLNSPEKSSLSIAYILSHYCPPGSLIGPNKGFGGWGYPEQNKVCRKVKKGSEQLIVFTNRELKKALKNRNQGRRERKNIEEK